jgi:hypothetical protein
MASRPIPVDKLNKMTGFRVIGEFRAIHRGRRRRLYEFRPRDAVVPPVSRVLFARVRRLRQTFPLVIGKVTRLVVGIPLGSPFEFRQGIVANNTAFRRPIDSRLIRGVKVMAEARISLMRATPA